MVFLEVLPEKCPPEAAKDIALEVAYRVVTCLQPNIEDFKSHAALELKKPPTCDPCKWSSCSLFLERDIAAEIATKLPKLRFAEPHLALVSIYAGAGLSLVNKRKHVDFWMSKKFDLSIALQSVEKL